MLVTSLTSNYTIMEHESKTADIGPQIREYRPNSNSENSTCIRAESPILSLTEHYMLNHAINCWDGPKYTTYNTSDARLRSFVINDWPHDLQPSPNALSEAGFFYTRKDDRTICFHCGGGLRDWLQTDDAWAQHAAWFPFCVFVRYIKGPTFIRECQRLRTDDRKNRKKL